MSVSAQETVFSHVGNGATVTFAYGCQVPQAADLQVYLDDVLVTSGFDVSGIGALTGGAVTFDAPPANGVQVRLERVIALERLTDYQQNGDFLARVVNPDFNRLWMALQQHLAVLKRGLMVPRTEADGPGLLPSAASRANNLLGFDAAGHPVAIVPNAQSAAALQILLSASNGSSNIGFILTAAGAVARWVLDKLEEQPATPDDFEADKTGATNTTAAMVKFFTHCITKCKPGHIPAGTYLVDEGALIFDTLVDAQFPDITTDGHAAVTFKAAGTTDAPIITISNGSIASGGNKFWRGGSLGGITFVGAATGVATHGISIRGTWGMKFGWMRGNNLRGDLINVPLAIAGGSPDPFATSWTTFEGLEANNCTGFVCNNRNYVGQDSWNVKVVRAVRCVAGVWFGLGSGCTIGEFSVGSCQGWAFDDGTNNDAPYGAPQRFTIGVAEFDNVQYGIRLNKSSIFELKRVRFIHRYNTAPNTGGNYWPRTALDLTGGLSANVRMGSIQVFHRIEGGGALAALGTFLDAHNNGNILGLEVDLDYADNGALGVTNAMMFSNINGGTAIRISRLSKVLYDAADKPLLYAYGGVGTMVSNNGYATAASAIAFANVSYQPYSTPYNAGTGAFTAARKGVYKVEVSLPLTLAVGTRVRMGVLVNAAARCTVFAYQVNAGIQTYQLNASVFLNAGETLQVIADQTTAGPVACTPNFDANEVRCVIAAL